VEVVRCLDELRIQCACRWSVKAFAIVGVMLGSYSSRYIEGEKLQKGFGYFLIAVAVFILIKR